MQISTLQQLAQYGRDALAYATGQQTTPPVLPVAADALASGEPQPPGRALQSLFTSITTKTGPVAPRYFSLDPLDPEKIIPKLAPDNLEKPATWPKAALDTHWQGFQAEYAFVQPGQSTEGGFETFCQLLRRWGWCLPAPYGEPDISLYEWFKLVAALTACAEVGTGLTVLSGDTVGIQRWLYTIQSQKATTTLRGRSFYLQLVSGWPGPPLAGPVRPAAHQPYLRGRRQLQPAPARPPDRQHSR